MLVDTAHTIYSTAEAAAKIADIFNADVDDDFTYTVATLPNGKAVIEVHDEDGIKVALL